MAWQEYVQGKRILITGASRGLGQACAEAFEKAGAKLYITGRVWERLGETLGSFESKGHAHLTADLTFQNNCVELADRVKAWGTPDAIVHCIGGGLSMKDDLLSWGDFDLLYKTNIAAPAEINRILIPEMENGNVVHVGSITSTDAVGSVGYNTVKAALAAYVRTLGNHLAPTGVIVTGILPGGFTAPGNVWEKRMENPNEETLKFQERLPRGKFGTADEMMPLLAFLCSSHASMMTGCMVPIDGGEGITYGG